MPRPKIDEPTGNLSIRIRDRDRALIDAAARAVGMPLTTFIRAAALSAATDVLKLAEVPE